MIVKYSGGCVWEGHDETLPCMIALKLTNNINRKRKPQGMQKKRM